MSLRTLSLALALPVLVAACDIGGGGGGTPPVTTDDTGTTSPADNGATGCQDACTDGAVRCAGVRVETCAVDGATGCLAWGAAADCPQGETCQQDKCYPSTCTPDCGARACGPVPNGCGDSCGTCSQGTCGANGQCDGGGGGEGSPKILSLLSNVQALSPDHKDVQLVITAIVTDPDGIDDLIGGTLLSPSGASYGAFATSAAEGSYEIRLTYDQIRPVDPLVSTPQGGAKRTFVAEFYDQAGHKVQQSIDVGMTCDLATAGICNDTCHDFVNGTEYCGSCANVIETEDECDNGVPGCRYYIADLNTAWAEAYGNVSPAGYKASWMCSTAMDVNYPLERALRFTAPQSGTYAFYQNYNVMAEYMNLVLREDKGTCGGAVLSCGSNTSGYDPMTSVYKEMTAGESVLIVMLTPVSSPSAKVDYRFVIQMPD